MKLHIGRHSALSCTVVAAISSVVLFAQGAGAAPKASSSPSCQVSAPAAPSVLDIQGQGFTPGVLYLVSVVTPYGGALGESLFPSSDGTLNVTTLPATMAGAYHVSISKLRGTSLTSCSTNVL